MLPWTSGCMGAWGWPFVGPGHAWHNSHAWALSLTSDVFMFHPFPAWREKLLAYMAVAFQYPLKIIARRSFHLAAWQGLQFSAARAFEVLLMSCYPNWKLLPFDALQQGFLPHLSRWFAACLQHWSWEQRTNRQGAWVVQNFSPNCREQENARLSCLVGSKNSCSWLHCSMTCFQEHVELMNVEYI